MDDVDGVHGPLLVITALDQLQPLVLPQPSQR